MYLIVITVLAFLSSHFNALIFDENLSSSKNYGGKTRQLIINGFDSPKRSFYAQLVFENGFCAATILNSRFVITAAHCVFQAEREFLTTLSSMCHVLSPNYPS